jgi:hypothetical protein
LLKINQPESANPAKAAVELSRLVHRRQLWAGVMLAVKSRIQQGRNHDHQSDNNRHRKRANSWRNNHIALMQEMRRGMKQMLQALGKLKDCKAP